MGLPARKLEPVRGAGRGTQPRLRLVRASLAAPAAATSARAEAACRSTFNIAVVALLALTVFGLARVGLSAKVAEASIDATKLRKTIKAETVVSNRLELDKSMLVTPSRIESIAAGALKMTKAAPVRYLTLPTRARPAAVSEGRAVKAAESGRDDDRQARPKDRVSMSGLVRAAMDVTEKEARTLLVGDVGLANPE